MAKHVYAFGGGKAEGNAKMKELLGGKGANLAEMAGMGIPVPPGFTITTQVCTYFDQNKRRYPAGLQQELRKAMAHTETIMKSRFGEADNRERENGAQDIPADDTGPAVQVGLRFQGDHDRQARKVAAPPAQEVGRTG